MQFAFLLEQVVNGLVLGGYYLLIALGLSLIFSVGGIVNLAHGAFYALGAYISVEITSRLGFGAAVTISPVAVALLGILFERFILRRFYTADPILSLLVTFGLAMVAEQAIRIIWGSPPLPASISADVPRLGLCRRFPVLALPPADPRRRRRDPARHLAVAAQDLVRPRGARRHPAAGYGGRTRHPIAALHDRGRHAWRWHGGAGRRVLCADHERSTRDGLGHPHRGLRRRRDRRPRQLLGRGGGGHAGRRGQGHHHPFRTRRRRSFHLHPDVRGAAGPSRAGCSASGSRSSNDRPGRTEIPPVADRHRRRHCAALCARRLRPLPQHRHHDRGAGGGGDGAQSLRRLYRARLLRSWRLVRHRRLCRGANSAQLVSRPDLDAAAARHLHRGLERGRDRRVHPAPARRLFLAADLGAGRTRLHHRLPHDKAHRR